MPALADAAAMPGIPLQRLVDRYHEVYGEGVLIVDSDGRTLAARGLSTSEPDVATAANHALVDAAASPWPRIRPWEQRTLPAAAGVRSDGELVGAVVVAVDTAVAAREVGIGWSWVAVGCLGLLVLAALVGRALTRWVLRPLNGLERAVADMTEGVAGPPADVAGPPELRHFTCGVQHDGTGGAGLSRSSTATRRRRVSSVAQSTGRRPFARGHPRGLRGRGGTADVRFDDRGAGPL